MQYADLLPDTYHENLEKRLQLREAALHDKNLRRAIWTACKDDVVFFFKFAGFVFEPRGELTPSGDPQALPFIPWSHQEPVIREIKKNLGKKDIGVSKSRTEGVSWIACGCAAHDLVFKPRSMIGMMSATEDKADHPTSLGSLMSKVEFILERLPKWMIGHHQDREPGNDIKIGWRRNKSEHYIINYATKAMIRAFAATKGTGRGDRFTWFLFDEAGEFPPNKGEEVMKALQQTTPSRLMVSTPAGNHGMFYDFMHTESNRVTLSLNWKKNPTKNRGLYRIDRGVMKAVDPTNPIPDGYAEQAKEIHRRLRDKGFQIEGVERSPWYDNECDRADSTPQSIAQELDEDYGGSMHKYFRNDFDNMAKRSCRPPFRVGELDFHPHTLRPTWRDDEAGRMLLWLDLVPSEGSVTTKVVNGKETWAFEDGPPNKLFVVACDIASGLGGSHTSNSTVFVLDCLTGEQVAEFASNTMRPEKFADFVIAVCKWFRNAYLIPEVNGQQGQAFLKRVIEREYDNLYYNVRLKGTSRVRSNEPGFHTTNKNKGEAFTQFRDAVISGEMVLRSTLLLGESRQFVQDGDRILHVGSTKGAASDRGISHGDRVTAAVLACEANRDRPISQDDVEPEIPYHSPAWFQREYEESLQDKDSVWDDRPVGYSLTGTR